MYALIGMGNPGLRYAKTRHNMGFMVLDALSALIGVRWIETDDEYVAANGRIAGQAVYLVKPLTYVNRSGLAVRHVLERLGLEVGELLVVVDDVHLPVGTMRLRMRGSDGGHKGLSSIIREVGTSHFPRLRLGVGRPSEGDLVEYVLGTFSEEEIPDQQAMIERALQTIRIYVREGAEAAMNFCNARGGPMGP